MVGMRDHLGQWWKVTEDCAQCGQCCLDRDPSWYFVKDELLGGCEYLAEEDDGSGYRCVLGVHRPFSCCGNSPIAQDYCQVRLEKTSEPERLLDG